MTWRQLQARAPGTHQRLAKLPRYLRLLVKCTSGNTANGSVSDKITCSAEGEQSTEGEEHALVMSDLMAAGSLAGGLSCSHLHRPLSTCHAAPRPPSYTSDMARSEPLAPTCDSTNSCDTPSRPITAATVAAGTMAAPRVIMRRSQGLILKLRKPSITICQGAKCEGGEWDVRLSAQGMGTEHGH